MPSNSFCHVSPRPRTRYPELLYHIAYFQGIFIRKAHQCSKRIERPIVVDELHIELIPFWQRISQAIPSPLLKEKHPHLSQSRVSGLEQYPPVKELTTLTTRKSGGRLSIEAAHGVMTKAMT